MWGDIAIAFLLAFITSFIITPRTITLAKKLGAVDSPKDERRVNVTEMPRLGGLAVISGFIVSVIYLLVIGTIEDNLDLFSDGYDVKLIGFFIGMAIIVAMGFIDDVKSLPALVKLLIQIIAAIVAVSFGIIIDSVHFGFIEDLGLTNIFNIILTIGWIVGVTNAINLIDGLDGLSTGISIISCVSLLIIFALNGSIILSIILITALLGALVGFLPFNYNPAKTFIGDTGSNFLGYMLAIISIFGVAKTYTAIVIVLPLIVLALPVFDTLFAIIRRIIKGKSIKAIFKPDAGHLHHKMIKRGLTQKQAVLILYALCASLGIFAIVLMQDGLIKALSFLLVLIVVIALGYKEVVNHMVEENKKEKQRLLK